MKIALFHNLPSGGAKRALFELTKRLTKNHELDLYNLTCSNEEFLALRTFVRGVFTYNYSIPENFFLYHLRIYFILPHVYKRMAAQINNGNYDLALINHCFLTQAPYLLRYLKPPTVYLCQEPKREFYEDVRLEPPSVKTRFIHLVRYPLKFIDRNNLRLASIVVANSKYSLGLTQKIYKVKPFLNYLGVDTKKFRPMSLKRENIVISVGRLVLLKGHDFIIKSIATIPKKRRPPLVLIGDSGDKEEYFNKLASDLEVDLVIKRNVDEEELIKWYNRARLLLFAPMAEPFGLVPLEGMACGLPVIGVAEGGVRESVINGKTGFLVRRDTRAFGEKILEALDSGKLAEMGKFAREYVCQNWTWDKSTARLEELFKVAIK